MKKGFGLLEIVLAVAIVAGTLYALASVFILGGRTAELSREKLQAGFLAEEGLEVLRFLRDGGWTSNIATLSISTDYYLSFNPATSKWSVVLAPPAKIEGVFERNFRIESVLRDSGDNIASSGTNDPDTKKIIMKIAWTSQNTGQTFTLEAYLTNLFDN